MGISKCDEEGMLECAKTVGRVQALFDMFSKLGGLKYQNKEDNMKGGSSEEIDEKVAKESIAHLENALKAYKKALHHAECAAKLLDVSY